MTPVVSLYTRAGCHLCDRARAVIEDAAREAPLRLEVVDIDADPELRGRYTNDIPVIAIDGVEAFRHRVERKELLRRLKR